MNLGNWRIVPDKPDGKVLYLFAGLADEHSGFPRWAGLFVHEDAISLLLRAADSRPTNAYDVGPDEMHGAVSLAYAHLEPQG